MTQEEQSLINKLIQDTRLDTAQECCYILATIKHETANTFKPIAEYGLGAGHSYGQPDPITGQTYYGRGYVQLTWKANYEKFGTLLNIDLLNHPDLAMNTDIAYDIMVVGMLHGLFTGKKLSDYITDNKIDYVDARRIINGLDKAQLIASYATGYDTIKTFG